MQATVPRESWYKRIAQALGPGVTTGAADDDPSGVATYSIVGAQYGTSFLWSALFLARMRLDEPPGAPREHGGLMAGARWIKNNAIIRAR